MDTLTTLMQELRSQLAESVRLRLGLWALLAILWGYGLLVISDQLPLERAAAEGQRSELTKLKALESSQVWEARLNDARQVTSAADALTWSESKSGLGQAEIQDWLRQVASKTGLVIRDLRLSTSDAIKSTGKPLEAGEQPAVVRLRIQSEFTPFSLVAFLSELGVAERGVVVERLQFKTWTKPPQAELDIRVKLRHGSGAP